MGLSGFNAVRITASTKVKDLARIRYIIEQRDENNRSFADIARELGLSRQRVQQIYSTYRKPR